MCCIIKPSRSQEDLTLGMVLTPELKPFCLGVSSASLSSGLAPVLDRHSLVATGWLPMPLTIESFQVKIQQKESYPRLLCRGSENMRVCLQVVLVVKNLPANEGDTRDVGLIPGVGRSPGGGRGNPLQYFAWRIPWTEESCGSDSFVIPWTIAHQAPLSMGFPRQEYWSRLLFPFPEGLPNPGIKLVSPVLAGKFVTAESQGKT